MHVAMPTSWTIDSYAVLIIYAWTNGASDQIIRIKGTQNTRDPDCM